MKWRIPFMLVLVALAIGVPNSDRADDLKPPKQRDAIRMSRAKPSWSELVAMIAPAPPPPPGPVVVATASADPRFFP